MAERLLANEKISTRLHQTLAAVEGDANGVTGLQLRDARTGEMCDLKVPGVFAAGDVRDTDLRQVLTAADGARAAIHAWHFIKQL